MLAHISRQKFRQSTPMALRYAYLLTLALVVGAAGLAAAGQGCPFDDGSCQEYCNQQGCNLGYCGHFAWIQCICRKCGDEWNWYDKVHYNPDKQVNQTELDSLKLNGSAPIILTNSNEQRSTKPGAPSTRLEGPVGGGQQRTMTVAEATQTQAQVQAQALVPAKQQHQKPATLTTLLIPDLSDGSKLDLNDIPDENSDKFLDYLAKNHEKLVLATTSQASRRSSSPSSDQDSDSSEDADELEAEQQATTMAATASPLAATEEPQAEETVEIQISSSNNQPQAQQPAQRQAATFATTTAGGPAATVTRLLRMAVAERLSDDLYK